MKRTGRFASNANQAPILAVALLALVAMGKLWAVPAAHGRGDPIVVIVNVSNPVENLSLAELRQLFLSDRSRWDTGRPVATVIPVAGAPERTSFLKIVCGMTDADLGKYFLQASFTGKSAIPPKEVVNAWSVKSFVANSPGAIGFIPAMEFHGDGSDGGIKAIRIDGFQAGDPAYRLRM
jgi:ABC-type phosphate transport system substrate-binding protein